MMPHRCTYEECGPNGCERKNDWKKEITNKPKSNNELVLVILLGIGAMCMKNPASSHVEVPLTDHNVPIQNTKKIDSLIPLELIPFIQHKHNCDVLQPMWHKGPCDCGLRKLLKEYPEWNIKDPCPPTGKED